MDIQIDRNGPAPLKEQISEQIVFLISTRALEPGDKVTSVRALAGRLGIASGTVDAAYQDLVWRRWLLQKRGTYLVVRQPDPPDPGPEDLDAVINEAMRRAVTLGYTHRELRRRVRERLQMAPPDHVLIIEDEPEMRRLLCRELSKMLSVSIKAVSPEELEGNRDVLTGALAVFLPGRAREGRILRILPRGCPYLLITLSGKARHIGSIQELKGPSVIKVVSVSRIFLDMAVPLLAPYAGDFHALEGTLIDEHKTVDCSGADMVICDTVASAVVTARRRETYHLVSSTTAQEISERIASAVD